MSEQEGKVGLVTGASKDIGAGITKWKDPQVYRRPSTGGPEI